MNLDIESLPSTRGRGCSYRDGFEAAKRETDRLKKQERNLIYLYRVGEYYEQLLGVETQRLKETQRKAVSKDGEPKPRLVTTSQAAEQTESTETYREWAGSNLESLDFEKKRLVLEALDTQVAVDDKNVVTRGFLPIRSPSSSPAFPTP